jgi:hypothetical protein
MERMRHYYHIQSFVVLGLTTVLMGTLAPTLVMASFCGLLAPATFFNASGFGYVMVIAILVTAIGASLPLAVMNAMALSLVQKRVGAVSLTALVGVTVAVPVVLSAIIWRDSFVTTMPYTISYGFGLIASWWFGRLSGNIVALTDKATA